MVYKVRFRRIAAGVLLGIVGLAAVKGVHHRKLVSGPALQHPYHGPRLVHYANFVLGSECPGVVLDLVRDPYVTFPEFLHLRIRYQGQEEIDPGIAGLRGFVHISRARQALSLVRLEAAPGNYAGCSQSEITDNATIFARPNSASSDMDSPHWDSGLGGVLSEDAFRKGGFSHPRVYWRQGQFVVERWILSGNLDRCTVKLIREDVGPDGSYQRETVRSMPPPRLPKTTFWFEGVR